VSRRRLLAGTAAIAAGPLLAAGCAGEETSPSVGQDEVTYMTAFGSFGREGYAYVAEAKGFFAKRNIKVSIQPGQGSTSNLQLLAAGKVQFSTNDLAGVWILQGNGKHPEARAVAAIQQNTLNSIMTLEQSGITSAKDLVGKKIGGAPGAAPQLLWPAYAKLTGVDPESVTWVGMQAQQTPGALASGNVAGIGQFVVASGTVEKAAGGRKTRALAYSDVITDLYGTGLVTTTSMIDENPDLVARFRDALLEGLLYCVQNPQESGELLHQAVPAVDAALAGDEMARMAGYVGGQPGVIVPERVARAVAILSGSGTITRRPAPEDLVALDLVPGGAAAAPNGGR
jgi:NitT/TauT family transport system substrate-binding protein